MPTTPHRREGFAGQHLVVVPKPVNDAAAKHALLRGLLVTDAGYFPHAEGHYVERNQGTPTHLVIACLRGQGWVGTKSGQRPVRAGDLVWLRANQGHTYGAAEDDPWTIGWVHFTGEEAEAWSKHIGFAQESVAVLSDASAEGVAALKIEQIYLILELGYSVAELINAALMLRSALNLAAHAVRNGGPMRSASERIAAVREHLRETLDQPHRLDELASAAGLSVPHFCALFRRVTGYAPIDFLIRQRIQAACRLLDTTDRSIASIAAEVGYEDPYYFTRCFRRVVGNSPRAYRRITKG
jgi:AraC family transcriptional regulator of arabinose operon